ncbi:MAG: RHS repeat-associated core domain-containing protein [Chloroflexi bacterium]|nr:RHS repeat-associated core domain-containing protein [Chloroflexota bacterium]
MTKPSKYYFAGTTRIAMRKYSIPQPMTVEYFLSDHLGSTSLTTDSAGTKVSEIKYKPWGELRSAWKSSDPQLIPSTYALTNYTFTGQYSYMDDPTTSGTTEGFGLMFYNARWYDPSLGRFAQADAIVPGGVQGLDRYAYVNNSPLVYTDPNGHWAHCNIFGWCWDSQGGNFSMTLTADVQSISANLYEDGHRERSQFINGKK